MPRHSYNNVIIAIIINIIIIMLQFLSNRFVHRAAELSLHLS